MSVDETCVLVGTDGSWHSGPVLDVAAKEASTRWLPLMIVSVVRTLSGTGHDHLQGTDGEDRARELTDWRLLEAVSRVRGTHPALRVRTHLLRDAELPGQMDNDADLPNPELLVVGALGAHDQPAFERGTVSRDLLLATACPVLVVPESAHVRPVSPATPPDAVVAALADDALSTLVLRAAVEQAAAAEAPLEVLHCYATASQETDARARSLALARCGQLVSLARAADPRWETITHSLVVTDERVARALTRLSTAASVIVLGTHRSAVLAGLSPDSVSREVISNSRCPVLLVPPLTTGSPSPPAAPQLNRIGP